MNTIVHARYLSGSTPVLCCRWSTAEKSIHVGCVPHFGKVPMVLAIVPKYTPQSHIQALDGVESAFS